MKVPLLDLNAVHQPIHDDLMAAMERVVQKNGYILGAEVEELEKRIAEYSQARYAIGVSSGTDALLLALMALGIGPGDEVITTDYSFFATAGCVSRVGAKPVFVDIDPTTYNLDPMAIRRAITPYTKALIPVHLFGQCAEMSPVLDVAKEYGLWVIEDAAQAIGAEYSTGQAAGSMGHIGCLSFFPTKNLGAFGDGGMTLTNDENLAEKMRILRAHGSKPKYHHAMIGGNFRLDALQAAVLNVKFGYLDTWTKQRQENARVYEELFLDSRLVRERVIGLPTAAFLHSGISHYHIYNQYVIRARERDTLQAYLRERGVATEVYYPVPFHLQVCFHHLEYQKGQMPESERAARESLALPVYPGLGLEEQRYVVETIHDFYRS